MLDGELCLADWLLGAAMFLILVSAKIIPEQIPDPIYVAVFFLS